MGQIDTSLSSKGPFAKKNKASVDQMICCDKGSVSVIKICWLESVVSYSISTS